MGIKNIIKNSLLNEVGEASKTPFRFKRDTESLILKDSRDEFEYVFKTKSGYVYNVNITREYGRSWDDNELSDEEWEKELSGLYQDNRKIYNNLRKLGLERGDFKNIWDVNFSIVDTPDSKSRQYNSMLPTYKYQEPNKGEFFKVMATVVKIIKEHLGKFGGSILKFSPYDDRRGNIFSQYMLRQLPNTKVWDNNGTFYFLLNVN